MAENGEALWLKKVDATAVRSVSERQTGNIIMKRTSTLGRYSRIIQGHINPFGFLLELRELANELSHSRDATLCANGGECSELVRWHHAASKHFFPRA